MSADFYDDRRFFNLPVYPGISLYNRGHLSHVQTCFRSFSLSLFSFVYLGWFLLFVLYMKYTAKEKEQ